MEWEEAKSFTEEIAKDSVISETSNDLGSSRTGSANDSVLNRIGRLHSILSQYHESQSKSNITFKNISKMHEEMEQSDKEARDESVSNPELKDMYEIAKQETIHEINLVRNALSILEEMHAAKYRKTMGKDKIGKKKIISKRQLISAINEGGAFLPLWIGNIKELPPPLCGAVPAESSYVSEEGDLVAAAIRVGQDDTWILAEVVYYNPEKAEYEVKDIDEKQKSHHLLEKNRVVPLPKMRANPIENPTAIFPREALVLALYPQTTCFYRAAVYKTPSSPSEPYELLFEDKTYETGYSLPKRVHQRYVINGNVSIAGGSQHTASESTKECCILKTPID